MKKTNVQTDELLMLISQSEDATVIKGVAQLFTKMNNLSEEKKKLVALQERISQMEEEIAQQVKAYQGSLPEKPKSNRGRKKKSVAN